MKKLFMVLGFFALLLSSLSARYIFDGKIIFSKHGAAKDSVYFLIVEKAGGVLDTVAGFDTTGTITWYYTFDITADSTSKIDTTYAPFQTYVAAHGGGSSVFDTVTIEGSDDTVDVYFSNDTLFFDSRIGSAYFDLSEFIVLFGSGTMNIDDHQPATNDSSSSQVGTVSNPYGQGCFAKLVGTKGPDITSASTITITKGVIHDITGNATIDSIVPGVEGQIIILQFDGTAVIGVTDGKNLRLAGNFGSSPNDVLVLYHSGNIWFEMSRSVN